MMTKGEIANFKQFFLLSPCFQKAVCCRKQLYEEKGYNKLNWNSDVTDISSTKCNWELWHLSLRLLLWCQTTMSSFNALPWIVSVEKRNLTKNWTKYITHDDSDDDPAAAMRLAHLSETEKLKMSLFFNISAADILKSVYVQ